MKVNFIRKPTPAEIYPQDEFIIEDVVRISKAAFLDLLLSPLSDRPYIKSNKHKMYIDEKNRWHCIYVFADC